MLQETQEENLQVEPAPLWASSYTKCLLYKAQDPFSACRQSCPFVPKQNFILSKESGCRTSLCFTDQETQEENLQGGTSSLVGQFLHTYLLYKAQDSLSPCRQSSFPIQVFSDRKVYALQRRKSGADRIVFSNDDTWNKIYKLTSVLSEWFTKLL